MRPGPVADGEPRRGLRRPGLGRLGAVAVLTGEVAFVAGMVVGSFAGDDYSPVRDGISELGASGADTFWVQNVSFVVFGLAVIAFSLTLRQAGGRFGDAASVLILVAGLGLVASGLIPCTARCPIHRGQPGTLRDALHLLSGVAAILPSLAAPLVVVDDAAGRRGLKGYAHFSRIVGCLGVAALMAFVVVGEPSRFEGLSQRALVVFPLAWLGVTATLVLGGALALRPSSAAPSPP